MTKVKIPKMKDKQELKAWVLSIGRENIDKKDLKDAHKAIKKNRKK